MLRPGHWESSHVSAANVSPKPGSSHGAFNVGGGATLDLITLHLTGKGHRIGHGAGHPRANGGLKPGDADASHDGGTEEATGGKHGWTILGSHGGNHAASGLGIGPGASCPNG